MRAISGKGYLQHSLSNWYGCHNVLCDSLKAPIIIACTCRKIHELMKRKELVSDRVLSHGFQAHWFCANISVLLCVCHRKN